ncbi:MAG: DUF4923 family protein [Rikenellaceae bacterium]|nr:DUF4923 family protein [Rikenellaceae bacterium]
MKKILLLIALTTMAFVQRADAQSLDALMRSITALFATDSEEQPAQQKETYPTAEKLKGRWIYDSLAIDYKGDSSVAALAVSTLESQLPTVAAKFELVAGRDNIMINDDGSMIITTGQTKNSAYCSNYDSKTGSATLMFKLKDQNISIRATVIDVNGKIKLMFNANELMDLIAKNYSKFDEMTTLQMAKGVFDSFPGIRVGTVFER